MMLALTGLDEVKAQIGQEPVVSDWRLGRRLRCAGSPSTST